MDSFVADYSSQDGGDSDHKMPPPPELQLPHQQQQPPHPQQQQQRPPTYISPSSSTATTPSHAPSRRVQDTIDQSAARNGETPVPRHAPTPFFSPSYIYQNDDSSEVSDGSFILHDTPGTPLVRQTPPPGQQPLLLPYHNSGTAGHSSPFLAKGGAADKRDRFPSFDDSVASAGSIHYVVPPNSTSGNSGSNNNNSGSNSHQSNNSKPKARAPPPAAPLTAQQIQQLPYHERRKLLAQRRVEPTPVPVPVPPLAVYGRGMPPLQQPPPAPRSDRTGLPMQPSSHAPLPHQQQQQQQPIYPPYPMPPPDHMYYGGVGGGSPIMMQHHQHHPLQQQQQQQQSPYHGRPLYPGVPPPPVGYGNYPMPQQAAAMGYYPMPPPGYPVPPPHMMPQQQQQQHAQHHHHQLQQQQQQQQHAQHHQHHHQLQQLQQQAYHASPRATDRLQTTGLPRGYTGLSSRPTHNNQSTIGRTRSSSLDSSDCTDKAPPPPHGKPPPPPPPPTPPPRHARADSVGSMSSLGSLERSSGREEEKDKKRRQVQSFLSRLNPWAVKEPTVDDYHRKNQAFLRKASQERSRNSPSPKQELRRVPLGSMDRPPPSRGTHKRLPSIDNDDWEEDGTGKKTTALKIDALQPARLVRTYSSGEDSGYGEDPSHLQSRVPPRFKNKHESEADERTRLLPPPGISSNEQSDKVYTGQTPDHGSSRLRPGQLPDVYGSVATVRAGNTTASLGYDYEQAKKSRRKKKKSRQRSRKSRQDQSDGSSDASHSSSSASSQDYHLWMKKRSRVLDKERTKLIKKWRSEARAEEEEERREQDNKMWNRRLYVYMEEEFGHVIKAVIKFLTWFEAFIANIPLTINAIALAVANLGVVWFKFAEENMESCEPVHYHSSQCTFPEFPGCFYCDTEARMYKVAVNFHWGCSTIAGILASLFICKLIIAPRVVFDELGSPTTAAPAGLFCMTLDIVFAGRGMVGQTLGT
jgi:hypothetical protein